MQNLGTTIRRHSPSSWRAFLGHSLSTAATQLIGLGIGVGVGYWAADREVRWLPTMVVAILALWLVASGASALGSRLKGSRKPDRKTRRVLGVLVLATSAALVVVLVWRLSFYP